MLERGPEKGPASLRAAVRSVGFAAFLARPHTMEWIRDQVLASDRFSMYLFVSFGLIAVLLATLGIYGVA